MAPWTALTRVLRRPRRVGDEPRREACANCGTPLHGPWCSACGQRDRDLHRRIGPLLREWLAGLIDFDARIWTTLPDLVFNPARLTRNFLAGRRAPQLPPLRLFLVVLVLLFFTSSLPELDAMGPPAKPMITFVGQQAETGKGRPGAAFADLTPAQRAEAQRDISRVRISIGGQELGDATRWLERRLNAALADPGGYAAAIETWARRLAILMLPIAAALLSLLFRRRREIVVFDHLIFAMHSLSFQGLLFSVVGLVNALPGEFGDWLLLLSPAHLFAHMRGVYRTGVIATLVRISVLAIGALAAFLAILLAALGAGLAQIGLGL
jgi:hypothetical protein